MVCRVPFRQTTWHVTLSYVRCSLEYPVPFQHFERNPKTGAKTRCLINKSILKKIKTGSKEVRRRTFRDSAGKRKLFQ